MDMDLVDPELRKPYRFMRSLPVANRIGLRVMRALMPLAGRAKTPSDIVFETMPCGQADGVRIFTPRSGSSGAAVLWIHGGGMIVGAASQDDARCYEITRRLDAVVVSAEYRLAPEHPFPAPLDDCFAAWTWLHDSAEARGIDPTRVAIGGQSAGGGLAAALVQRIHDMDGVQPTAQWLFCPMLDDRTAAKHELDATKHILWSNKSNRAGWSAYLGVEPGAATTPDYTVPARRADLSGLPPAWIGTGDIELFYDENRVYAAALEAAGVECVLDVVPGAPHGFETVASGTRIAQAYLDRSFEWLQTQLIP